MPFGPRQPVAPGATIERVDAAIVLALMVAVGIAVGFRIHHAIVLGGPTVTYAGQSPAWVAGIVAVFAPLGAWRYHRTA